MGQVRKFVKSYNIQQMLDENDGLVHMENFLPQHVAAAVHRALGNLPTSAWEQANGTDDEGYDDSIQHNFGMAELIEDDEGTLLELGRLLWLLVPDMLPNFTAAKYLKGDHITPHDDDVVESYSREDIRQVMTEVGGRPPKTYSAAPWDRKIALILYFNKEWKGSWGGQLVDMQADKKILPLYNSLVLFQVPRMHCVMPVVGAHSRLSIFGWWLTQQAGGVEVACDEEEEDEEDDEEADEDEDDEECPELLAPSTEDEPK